MTIRYIGMNEFTNNAKYYQEAVDKGTKIILTSHGKTKYMLSKVPKKYQGMKIDPLLTVPTPMHNKSSQDWSMVDTWEKELSGLKSKHRMLTRKLKDADAFCRRGIQDDIKTTEISIIEVKKKIMNMEGE